MASKDGIPVIKPFNPLDKSNLGESVADAAMNTLVQHLPPEPFIGAGVYMLYYVGNNPLYTQLADAIKTESFKVRYMLESCSGRCSQGRFRP